MDYRITAGFCSCGDDVFNSRHNWGSAGKNYGYDQGYYESGGTRTFSLIPGFVEKRLDEGKWVVEPFCAVECHWTTEGTGIFGGPEAGHVIYDYNTPNNPIHQSEKVSKVLFRWYNPRSGTNTCGAVVLWARSNRVGAGCDITQGNFATAQYWVNYRNP